MHSINIYIAVDKILINYKTVSSTKFKLIKN